jgi:hypothetical protein
MKLETKSSPSSQFVSQHNIPSVQAFSDTNVIMSAYLVALEALLMLCSTETESEVIVSSMYQNFSTLRAVRSEIDEDLERADVMLEAIEAKLAI